MLRNVFFTHVTIKDKTDEGQEQKVFFVQVLWPLVTSGLIDNAQKSGNVAVGSPDQLLFSPSGITNDLVAVDECKSTHNLPWPIMAVQKLHSTQLPRTITEQAFVHGLHSWTHIGHGLAQLGD